MIVSDLYNSKEEAELYIKQFVQDQLLKNRSKCDKKDTRTILIEVDDEDCTSIEWLKNKIVNELSGISESNVHEVELSRVTIPLTNFSTNIKILLS